MKQALTGEFRKLCVLCACPYVVYINGCQASPHCVLWDVVGDGGQASPHWEVGQKTLCSLCMPYVVYIGG